MDREEDHGPGEEHVGVPRDAPLVVVERYRPQRPAVEEMSLGDSQLRAPDRREMQVVDRELDAGHRARVRVRDLQLLVGLFGEEVGHDAGHRLYLGARTTRGLLPRLTRVAAERLVPVARLSGGCEERDPAGLRSAGTEVHGRVRTLGEEAEGPQGGEQDHPPREGDHHDQVPHPAAEDGGQDEVHAPHEEDERHENHAGALGEGSAVDAETETGLHHGSLGLVAAVSRAAIEASSFRHTFCSNGTFSEESSTRYTTMSLICWSSSAPSNRMLHDGMPASGRPSEIT